MFKKIRNKVNSTIVSAKCAIDNRKAEGYVDSGVKILIAVVIGALLLAGLYTHAVQQYVYAYCDN